MNNKEFKFNEVIVKFGDILDPTIVEPDISQHTISNIINKYFQYLKYNNNWCVHDSILALTCIEKLSSTFKIASLKTSNKYKDIYIYFETEDYNKYFVKINKDDFEYKPYNLFDLENYRMKCDHVYIIPMESGETNAKISSNKAWIHNDYDFELNFNEVLIDSIMEINEAAFKLVQNTFNNMNLKDEDRTNLNNLINDKNALKCTNKEQYRKC